MSNTTYQQRVSSERLACLALQDAAAEGHHGVLFRLDDATVVLVHPPSLEAFAKARGLAMRSFRRACRRLPFRCAEVARDRNGFLRHWRVLSIDALDEILGQAETARDSGR